MHISLDAALQRQPLLSTVGDKLLPSFPGAAAAYSLRSLNGDANDVVEVRRDGDADGSTNERAFTAEGVSLELEDWVNGKLETTLPCDVATSAAAYSLRKVKADYAGDAVRIRRTTDNVEVNVSFDANDKVSTSSAITNVTESPDRGDTTATTLGGFLTEGGNQDATVVTWYDQSGNGYDATQDTAGSQPKIAEAGSLLDELSFDGVGDYMDITGLTTLSNPFTLFQVVDLDNVNTSPNAFRPNIDGIDTDTHRIITGNTQEASFDGFFAGTNVNAGSIVTDIALRSYFYRGDATSAYFRNGTSVAVGDVGSQTPDSGIRIGADHDLSGSNSQIRFKEFIIYNSDQSDNRFKIESNINNHYGLYTASHNGFVRTWYDQSGNSKDATQPTQNNQPKIVNAGSYLGEVDFDGTDDVLLGNHVLSANNLLSLHAVAKYRNNTDRQRIVGNVFYVNNSDNGGFALENNVVNQVGIAATFSDAATIAYAIGSSSDINVNNDQLSTLELASGTLTLYNDGASVDSTSAFMNAEDGGADLQIGGNTDGSAALDGTIKELVIYNSDQSANRTGIESNIADEYGITLP